MKVKTIKVPFYKWVIISIVIEKYEDKLAVLKKMKALHMRLDDIENMSELLDGEALGGANCYYNDNKLLCVIVTFPHRDSMTLTSTLIHEGRHAADRIIETVGLEGSEAAAYLTEHVTMELIKDYIKDETYRT